MPIRVLVVDDSMIMCNLVSQALAGGGFEPVVAGDGEQALAVLAAQPVDMIITDINMPVMDGLALIKAVRETNGAIPIFALTSESDVEMREKGRAAGANGWIIKPFNPPQFLDLVRQIVDRFGLAGKPPGP